MIRNIITFATLLIILAEIWAQNSKPVILTNKGPVEGIISYTLMEGKPYHVFRGIPYAKPPLRDLRFKPPEEPNPWNYTLSALRERDECPQFDLLSTNFIGDEDCLYLNVYSPQPSNENAEKELKPVMIFIHGGSFAEGYGNSSLFTPDMFLEEDIIVITFNYRLGALGFLSLDHPDALGNAGLKDQNLVLKWVNQNIEKFDGDPLKVTIMGQSAGGASVDYHVLSEKSKGLFRSSISMSASVLCPWALYTPIQAQKRAFLLGSALGFKTNNTFELLNFLRNSSAYDIVDATYRFMDDDKVFKIDPTFKPTLENPSLADYEDIFITDCLIKKYLDGDYNKHPRIMGFTRDEMLLYAKPLKNALIWLDYLLFNINDLINLYSGKPLGSENSKTHIFEKIRTKCYDVLYSIVEVASDVTIKAEIDTVQKLMSENNLFPIYYYELDYPSEHALHKVAFNIDLEGTAHGDDFGYLFTIPNLNISNNPKEPINIFRRTMVRLWSNFIKYNNPTPPGKNDSLLDVNWPDSRFSGQQLIIGENLEVASRQVSSFTEYLELGFRISAPFYTGCSWVDAV